MRLYLLLHLLDETLSFERFIGGAEVLGLKLLRLVKQRLKSHLLNRGRRLHASFIKRFGRKMTRGDCLVLRQLDCQLFSLRCFPIVKRLKCEVIGLNTLVPF
jgi:hypothetical protein